MNTTARNDLLDQQGFSQSTQTTWATRFKPSFMFDANAVRARAGILNIIIGTTIAVMVAKPEANAAVYASAVLLFDMIAAVVFGLTPLSPTGVAATVLTSKFEPVRTPNLPKRFAWMLGASLSAICLTLALSNVHQVWIVGVLGIFFVLTWLDSAVGFCVGCWIYSKMFGCQACRIG